MKKQFPIVIGKELTEKPLAATIGMFDGVHRGHSLLLRTLRSEARQRGLTPVAITFANHPKTIVNPTGAPPLIIPAKEKIRLLEEREMVKPLVLEFNNEIRGYNSFDWMEQLYHHFNVKFLLIGYDNTFGKDGRDMLMIDFIRFGKQIGIEVVEAPALIGISSSVIRKAIENGDMPKVKELLGRPFEMYGTVIEGNKLGRKLGFPTANLEIADNIVKPKTGVYAGEAKIPGEGNGWKPAMINIGLRPTIGDLTAPQPEVHILNWDGDLYGQELRIRLHNYLREEVKFESVEQLKEQLTADRMRAVDLASTAFGQLL